MRKLGHNTEHDCMAFANQGALNFQQAAAELVQGSQYNLRFDTDVTVEAVPIQPLVCLRLLQHDLPKHHLAVAVTHASARSVDLDAEPARATAAARGSFLWTSKAGAPRQAVALSLA
eukprot:CAMPEP_0204080528 /NCGR_PEP_ID=MMETSP0360-20130528/174143_1 /ASSEMBLY_ACC=CAM_ASM_000342 /TAXON_ID=268821 /ORGANISM="Scrippsiella Hangoei, Strain SHTV-5" /LENGTH=116 /DNA_ID=CAMNT_0051029313 /DNA_START=157 /DNA_END=504 /DNA_ORIENTATION=+